MDAASERLPLVGSKLTWSGCPVRGVTTTRSPVISVIRVVAAGGWVGDWARGGAPRAAEVVAALSTRPRLTTGGIQRWDGKKSSRQAETGLFRKTESGG